MAALYLQNTTKTLRASGVHLSLLDQKSSYQKDHPDMQGDIGFTTIKAPPPWAWAAWAYNTVYGAAFTLGQETVIYSLVTCELVATALRGCDVVLCPLVPLENIIKE